MTRSSKQLICLSNPCQATVNYQTYMFLNKPKLFPQLRQMYSETRVASD